MRNKNVLFMVHTFWVHEDNKPRYMTSKILRFVFRAVNWEFVNFNVISILKLINLLK